MSTDCTTNPGSDNPHGVVNPPSLIFSLPVSSVAASKTFYSTIGGSVAPFAPIPQYGDDKTVSFRLPDPNGNACVMLHSPERFAEFMRADAKAVVDATKTTEVIISLSCTKKEDVDGWLERVVAAGGKADPYTMKDYGAFCGMYVRSWTDPDGHVWECVAMIGMPDCVAAKAAETKE